MTLTAYPQAIDPPASGSTAGGSPASGSTPSGHPTPTLRLPDGWLLHRGIDSVHDALRPLRDAAEARTDAVLRARVEDLARALAGSIDAAADVCTIVLPGSDEPLPMAIVVRDVDEPTDRLDARAHDALRRHAACALEGALDVLRWVALLRDGDVLVHTTSYLALAPGHARTRALLVTSTAIATVDAPAPLQRMGVLADTIVGSVRWVRADAADEGVDDQVDALLR